jgi:hypothetical protein
MPAPPTRERHFRHADPFLRMHEARFVWRSLRASLERAACQNSRVLCHAGLHAEHDHVSRPSLGNSDRNEIFARRRQQRLRARHVAPVARIRRELLRLSPLQFAPNPSDQAEAIAADALEACLVVIGRADPV